MQNPLHTAREGSAVRKEGGRTDRKGRKDSKFDFLQPKGEEALLPADSVTWRIFKNPVSMFVGGITAVLLEFAEPRVRDGVWNNTSFRTDPMGRLRRTGLAAMVTVYGPRSKAESMIAGIRRMHGKVSGITAEGFSYNANDEELLNWVQATASFGFLEAYCQLVKPLSPSDKDSVYREGAIASNLYGAVGAPDSLAAQQALFAGMRPQLKATPINEEFLELMLRTPVFPFLLRPFQRMLVRAAVDILPDWAQESLNLRERWQLKNWERSLIRFAGRLADRVVIKSSPAVHACRRLGLPENYLYRVST